MSADKTLQEIGNVFRKFILENYLLGYEEKQLRNDLSFWDMGVLDSTGIIELVMFTKKEFNIEVSDIEILPGNLDSINCISNYVYSKLALL